MTSSRPYLIRAIHEWISDNGLTPQLVIDAEIDGVIVPRNYVVDNRIVLNVAERAVKDLDLGDDLVQFNARFSGSSFEVNIPTRAILAVYAAENGVGMAFQEEENDHAQPSEVPRPTADRGHLKVVK